jgi:hypothetical protein
VVSVKADMGVLCLLDDLRSRALALPVPFLDAGAMMVCCEGVASAGQQFGRFYLIAVRVLAQSGITVAVEKLRRYRGAVGCRNAARLGSECLVVQ